MTPVRTTPEASAGIWLTARGHAAVGRSRQNAGNESLAHQLPAADDPEHAEADEDGNDGKKLGEDLGRLDQRRAGQIGIDDKGRTEEREGAQGVEADGRKGYGDKGRVSEGDHDGGQDRYGRRTDGHEERAGADVDSA